MGLSEPQKRKEVIMAFQAGAKGIGVPHPNMGVVGGAKGVVVPRPKPVKK